MKKQLFTLMALMIGFATYSASLVSFNPLYEGNKMKINFQVASNQFPLMVSYFCTDATNNIVAEERMLMQNINDSIVMNLAPGEYKFTINVNNGEDVREYPLIAEITTGVPTLETLNSITTFGKQLTIAGDIFIGKPYMVTNLLGQQVKMGVINSTKETITLDDPTGYYVVAILTDAGQVTKKILIN